FAFSPDGKSFAGCSATGLQIWEVATGREILRQNVGRVRGIVFSPDGRTLALLVPLMPGGNPAPVRLLNGKTGQETGRLAAHPGGAFRLAFSPDGKRLATCGGDRSVKGWDIATGRELFSLSDRGWAYALAFSPDSERIAWAGESGFIRVSEAKTG